VLDAVEARLHAMSERVRRAFHTPKGATFYRRLDGSNVADRTDKLRQFEDDEHVRVALLSLTAFSTGITLNAASTVIFLELYGDWTELEQAEARCARRRDSVACQTAA
jgi:SNF2 family DNA or RNA helicase